MTGVREATSRIFRLYSAADIARLASELEQGAAFAMSSDAGPISRQGICDNPRPRDLPLE